MSSPNLRILKKEKDDYTAFKNNETQIEETD